MYQVNCYGFKTANCGDVAEFGEQGINIYDNGQLVKQYEWSDLARCDYHYLNSGRSFTRKPLELYILKFNDGKNFQFNAIDNREAVEYLKKVNSKIRNARSNYFIAVIVILFVLLVFIKICSILNI